MGMSGFVSPSGTKAYFFDGTSYWRYDIAANQVDPEYPKPIAGNWPGLFESDIDAVVLAPNGFVYFFKADTYAKFDWAANSVVDGYPQYIAGNWPGVFESAIDACISWPNGALYFFRHAEYQRFDWAANAVPDGYPRPIAGNWAGLFGADIDVALMWPTGKAYFFSGAEYVRFDPAQNSADAGYPRPIAGNWPGLAGGTTGGGQPSGSTRPLRDYFPAFSTSFEGRVPWMYQDIKGLVTVAIGNLIDSPGAAAALPFEFVGSGTRASQGDITAEWTMIKNAPGLATGGYLAAKAIRTLELSEASMDDLVRSRFDADETRLAAFYPDWNNWPMDARLGAHSIAWAGAHFPNGWPSFNAAVNSGDWATAAVQSHLKDDDNPGVTPRNAANHTLFSNAGTVIARGLDRTVLYYPTAL